MDSIDLKDRVGELRFSDGSDADAPSTLYDRLDSIRGIDAFLNGFPLVLKRREARRAAAIAALLLPPLMLVLAVVVMVQEFPRVLFVFALLLVGFAAFWYGLIRRGAARALGLAVGILALAAMVILLVDSGDHVGAAIVIVAGLALAALAARSAFTYHAPLPDAPAPRRARPLR